MSKEQTHELIRQAAARGDDVTINISAHVAVLLRTLADDIESGKQQVGLAEMRIVQEHRPFCTYVVSVKKA